MFLILKFLFCNVSVGVLNYSVHLWCRDQVENVVDEKVVDDETKLEEETDEEIAKLSYFLEETDELIELRDYTEIENIKK